ncbi:unnamed protein product [Didymodactylos carnosus]|uniref:Homeobox domain-containing protein n=1 Tax=Didymodactylos carnosus TaxID=1234261 RepID=A0A814NJ61_9BILA|nr:unnamed protein product [Didymodactylos carnosus]CAF3859746.1 unnamed protein product [Didymodactylos carnosus]
MDDQQSNSKIIISDIKQNISSTIMSINDEFVSPTKSDSLKKLSFSIESILEKNDTTIIPLSQTNTVLNTLNNNNYKLIKDNSSCSKKLLSLTYGDRQILINENQPRLSSDLGINSTSDSRDLKSNKTNLKLTYPSDELSLTETSTEVSLLIPSYHHSHPKPEQSPKIKALRLSVDGQISDCHTSSDELDESLDDDYSKDSDDIDYSSSSRHYPPYHGENGITHHSDRRDIHDMLHRKKKTRTVFSRSQIFQLEATFDMKRYLSSADRANLAQALHLTEQQVKIWFQNRRNKLKRQIVEASQSVNAVSAVLQNAVSQNTPTSVISSISANQNGNIKRPLPVTPINHSKIGGHRFESFLYSPTSVFFDQLAATAAAAAAAQNLAKNVGISSAHNLSSSLNGHSLSSGYSFQDFYVKGITHVA